LRLWLRKNGEIKQDSNTQYMLFRIADLIADISSGITLEPGDVIATGTPAGLCLAPRADRPLLEHDDGDRNPGPVPGTGGTAPRALHVPFQSHADEAG